MERKGKMPHRKERLTFSHLQRILDLLTAKSIMTPCNEFFFCQPDQKISDARRLLGDKKFSAAPLHDVDIHRYVTLKKLEKTKDDATRCEDVADEITVRDVATGDTNIKNLLEIFFERKDPVPLFVLERNSITGLITGADLDKIAVKVFFFVLISALESLLLDIIGDNYKKYKECLTNPREVEGRYGRCKGQLVGLEEHHYLMTKEIFEIVWGSDIGKIMNVKDEKELKALRKFRNRVAHGNYIIVKDDDVKDLKRKYDRICEFIHVLERY